MSVEREVLAINENFYQAFNLIEIVFTIDAYGYDWAVARYTVAPQRILHSI